MIESVPTIKKYLLTLQADIIHTLEKWDEAEHFGKDGWHHEAGGGGITRVLSNGNHIEKAAVNFSHIFGNALPAMATAKKPQLLNCSYQAMGVSVVIHPRNPFVPTAHLNVRFFMAETDHHEVIWWFGGGIDLTPYYGFKEDCIHWHKNAKAACESLGEDLYPRFKKACDDYFFLKHRNEARGIGGLFFDDFDELGFDKSFTLMQRVGDYFLLGYMPIIQKRMHMEYEQKHRDFQCYRRGRYVEFNLLYDRGTLFGLQSNGRTESILVSLPPQVSWIYNWVPQAGTPEAELYQNYLIPQDWINVK